MAKFPPDKHRQLINMLLRLGFEYQTGGKHQHKFSHPDRKVRESNQPSFIIIGSNITQGYVKLILKELRKFGFTDDDMRDACK